MVRKLIVFGLEPLDIQLQGAVFRPLMEINLDAVVSREHVVRHERRQQTNADTRQRLLATLKPIPNFFDVLTHCVIPNSVCFDAATPKTLPQLCWMHPSLLVNRSLSLPSSSHPAEGTNFDKWLWRSPTTAGYHYRAARISAINSMERQDMTDKRLVFTTAGSKDEAHEIAHALVERRLAACVNIAGPIKSVYRWKGEVEDAQEWLLIIKTTAAAFESVRDAIRELHSYELPECIMLPIEAGSAEYISWIGENVVRP